MSTASWRPGTQRLTRKTPPPRAATVVSAAPALAARPARVAREPHLVDAGVDAPGLRRGAGAVEADADGRPRARVLVADVRDALRRVAVHGDVPAHRSGRAARLRPNRLGDGDGRAAEGEEQREERDDGRGLTRIGTPPWSGRRADPRPAVGRTASPRAALRLRRPVPSTTTSAQATGSSRSTYRSSAGIHRSTQVGRAASPSRATPRASRISYGASTQTRTS